MHWAFHIVIFSSMKLHLRACYIIVYYVIVNDVTSAAFESKMKDA